MGRSLVRGLAVGIALGFAGIFGCSSGGSSSVDLAGLWQWSVTMTQNTCGGAVGEVRTAQVTIQQSGEDVTILVPADAGSAMVPVAGRLDGTHLLASASYSNPPWTLQLAIDANAAGGGATLAGSMDFTWRHAPDGYTCVERGSLAATKL